jgi:hypothetical protein
MQPHQPLHPALQLSRPATAGRDVRTELQRKEHELSNLRMAALRALEQQVSGISSTPLITRLHYTHLWSAGHKYI